MLPRPMLDEVHRQLRQRVPYRAIIRWLAEHGHRIPLATFGDYGKKWRARQAEFEDLHEIAAMARESGVDVLDLASDLAGAAALQAGTLVDQGIAATGADGEVLDAALRRTETLARVVRTLEAAAVAGDDRRVNRAAAAAQSDDAAEPHEGWQPGFIWPDGTRHDDPPPVDLTQPNMRYTPDSPAEADATDTDTAEG